MKKRVLRTITVVTLMVTLGSMNAFGASNVMKIVRTGSENVLANAKVSSSDNEDSGMVKLMRVCSENLLNNMRATIVMDGDHGVVRKSLKDLKK